MYRLCKCKATCPKGPRVYSIEEKHGRNLVLKNPLTAGVTECVCNCLYGRCNHT